MSQSTNESIPETEVGASSSASGSVRNDEGDLSLLFLLRVLWTEKLRIVASTIVFALLAVFAAMLIPNEYRSTILLAPKSSGSASGLNRIAGRYSGLASLAGIELGSNSPEKVDSAIEILRSKGFLIDFVHAEEILVPLMAANGWNRESDKLLLDVGLYDAERNEWIRDVTPPQTVVPSDLEAYDEVRDRLAVSQDPETGFITVSLEFYSPKLAKQWLESLIKKLDQNVRAKDIAEANAAISYLNDQLERTSLADLRAVFYGLIEEQTKTVMLANMSDTYLFDVLDAPFVAEKKSSPNRVLIVAVGTTAGLMCGVLWALFAFFGSRKTFGK